MVYLVIVGLFVVFFAAMHILINGMPGKRVVQPHPAEVEFRKLYPQIDPAMGENVRNFFEHIINDGKEHGGIRKWYAKAVAQAIVISDDRLELDSELSVLERNALWSVMTEKFWTCPAVEM